MSKQKYPQTASSITSGGGASRSSVRKNYSHAKLDAKKERKRRQAEDRQDRYDALSTTEKLQRLGPTGSNRQRKRLETLLAAEKAPKVKIAPLTTEQKDVKAIATAQAAVQTAPRGGSKKKKAAVSA